MPESSNARVAPRPQRFASERACSRSDAGGELTNKPMFYTYVLKSEKDGKLYVGFCEDLKIRLKEHQNGFVKSTKNRRPLVLIYYEACKDKQDAINREKQLKTGFGRAYLKRRITNS